MENTMITSRLLLEPVTLTDSDFIFKLVNTKGWLEFIGDRNVRSTDDAATYIDKIAKNPMIQYWVVKLKDSQLPIGVITLIKRDYLDHPDIGFAFLPEFAGHGYAQEAARSVLNKIIKKADQKQILATTIPSNFNSVKLLKNLGFEYAKTIIPQKETLHVYSLSLT